MPRRPPLINTKEAAKILKLGAKATRAWLRDRSQRHPDLIQKVGRVWYVQVTAFEAALGYSISGAETDPMEDRVAALEFDLGRLRDQFQLALLRIDELERAAKRR